VHCTAQHIVSAIGKHTACGEQHELTTQTEVFDIQVNILLLHGSKVKHSTPGARYTRSKLLLMNDKYHYY
jgi:hypothetical protein